MTRRRTPTSSGNSIDVDAAIAALDENALRDLLRELLLEVDERLHRRILDRLTQRAARSEVGWAPEGPRAETVERILAFARAAEDAGFAEPLAVDEYLRQGIDAFLTRDYAAAQAIFRALLVPIGEGEIYLGEDELVEEVLTVDLAACAAMHAVAAYMLAAPGDRAAAVRSAIDDVLGFGEFEFPVREMERVAVEPLPDIDDFLPRWRRLIEARPDACGSDWERDEDRWLREAVERTEGATGLEKLARATGRGGDLRAWCRALVSTNDWKAALAACDAAAGIIADDDRARGEFLDGAALAAHRLGRRDLATRLELAWREAPTVLRLRRWLGSATTKATVRKRAADALASCPKRCVRQSALVHVLLGQPGEAAKQLARAPGLGWSSEEHPGHLLFALFQRLLGDTSSGVSRALAVHGRGEWHDDMLGWLHDEDDRPRLDAPEIEDLLALAGADRVADDETRSEVLRAMQKTAEKRTAGVTGKQRRNYYRHAASLIAACAELDASPQTTRWVAGMRERFRRYPAFQRELGSFIGE